MLPAETPHPTDAELASILTAPDEPLSHYVGLPGAPSRATMLRAIERGELAATYVGKTYRVRRDDFASWAASRRVPSSVRRGGESA